MSLFDFSVFAQAAPAAETATAGQIASGMLVLPVMGASLVMIVVWARRISETGHALPAAQRGILRVPLLLTMSAIGLSLLMLTLMSLVALQDPVLTPGVAGSAVPNAIADTATGTSDSDEIAGNNAAGEQTTATSPAEDPAAPSSPPAASDPPTESEPSSDPVASGETSVVDNVDTATATAAETDSEAPSAAGPTTGKSTMTPTDMVRALWQTVVMDFILFGVFGFVIFVYSSEGRVYLSDTLRRVGSATTDAIRKSTAFAGATLWPDLDEPSPTSPFGNPVPAWPTTAAPIATANPMSDPKPATELQSTASEAIAGLEQNSVNSPALPEEPFSFLTELRFAGEVFLAAYAPTAVLRIFIVLLTVGLLGEEPDQHPFLEMMKSGVGAEILILIVLTAVILAPVVEELQFRVVMLGGIAQLGHPILALGVSSVLFAFAHGFPDSLALIPLAFALGYTYLRRRSYISVMLVHFLFNAFNMLLALLAML